MRLSQQTPPVSRRPQSVKLLAQPPMQPPVCVCVPAPALHNRRTRRQEIGEPFKPFKPSFGVGKIGQPAHRHCCVSTNQPLSEHEKWERAATAPAPAQVISITLSVPTVHHLSTRSNPCSVVWVIGISLSAQPAGHCKRKAHCSVALIRA